MKILVQSTGLDIVPGIIAELRKHQPGWEYFAWPSDEPCDYVVGWKPPAELFAKQPKLKAVINYGAGVDAILAMGAVPPHLPIVRLEDAGMARQMAEYAIYGVIHHQRHLQIYLEQQRAKHWQQHEDRGNVRQPTVGVLGLGEMGGAVARKLATFGYPVRGWSRSRHQVEGMTTFAGMAELPAFLAGCDVLVSMLPLTELTRGLINAVTLAQLPRGAFLVNAGRGGHLVDADVVAALDSGQLGGALLDVFHEEPLPQDHPYWSHPKVIVTPHIAATTPIKDACAQIVDKIAAMERGEFVSGIVDPKIGY
ncbi:MAG: glyoxylate/hydroxypyruvate reductase A [Burkholderiales bacterium]|nr:glyoxylate/hydroxypyruvate reductase A [Burkholderiales bacterium]